MKNKTLSAFLFSLAAVATASPVFAGKKLTAEVTVVAGDHGSGSLADARNSPDGEQTIGCQIWASAGSSPEMFCWAVDKAGNAAGCYSKDPALVAVASTLSGDSYLEVYIDDSKLDCKGLAVWNTSELAPKK